MLINILEFYWVPYVWLSSFKLEQPEDDKNWKVSPWKNKSCCSVCKRMMKLLIYLLWRSKHPYCVWRTTWIHSYWRWSVAFMVLPGSFSIIPAWCLKLSHESYHIFSINYLVTIYISKKSALNY
jgi:hypothetical protein